MKGQKKACSRVADVELQGTAKNNVSEMIGNQVLLTDQAA